MAAGLRCCFGRICRARGGPGRAVHRAAGSLLRRPVFHLLILRFQPYRRTGLPKAPQPLQHSIRVAVIGRPNVGKSTFVNAVSGGIRHLLVGPEPGITRDCIDVSSAARVSSSCVRIKFIQRLQVPVVRNGRSFVFVDTAGVRRK